jgi:hypothetical protein
MMEEITQLLWKASEKKRVCRIQLQQEPLPRLVHPYGICRSSGNRVVLVCWQERGFTRAGASAGYRNLKLSEFDEVEMLEAHFQKRDDFNPLDGQYREWVYHL